jgi:hypothetical protein
MTKLCRRGLIFHLKHHMGQIEDHAEDIWWILEGHGYPRLWRETNSN